MFGSDFQKKKDPRKVLGPVMRIETLLIRIRILLFTLVRIRILLFNLIRIRIRLFDTDPDPYHFKDVMYLKWYFSYIFIWFSLSVGPTGPTKKVFFVKFSLPVNFVVLNRVAYGSGSGSQPPGEQILVRILNIDTDPDPQDWLRPYLCFHGL